MIDRYEQLSRAQEAAKRAGYAGAMLANLYVANSSGRTGVWSDEQRVWQERMDRLSSGLGHNTHMLLGRLSAVSFQANLVNLPNRLSRTH